MVLVHTCYTPTSPVGAFTDADRDACACSLVRHPPFLCRSCREYSLLRGFDSLARVLRWLSTCSRTDRRSAWVEEEVLRMRQGGGGRRTTQIRRMHPEGRNRGESTRVGRSDGPPCSLREGIYPERKRRRRKGCARGVHDPTRIDPIDRSFCLGILHPPRREGYPPRDPDRSRDAIPRRGPPPILREATLSFPAVPPRSSSASVPVPVSSHGI